MGPRVGLDDMMKAKNHLCLEFNSSLPRECLLLILQTLWRRYGGVGDGNILLSRIGSSDDGSTNVGGSGTSTGKGVYSSSSSSMDSTGKITYSAHAGRI